ncbi:hypothetical protein G7Y89_g15047 [Cudoniella acicularis]|uniref:Uncharacterized protein n=1 Tax=Cudoniella acicularis TaxID=354080 RepID=A0A8H4QUI4_9HELO|nr:hypothetical protein G7Y89_g15047 [Cudoniella acicularis]
MPKRHSISQYLTLPEYTGLGFSSSTPDYHEENTDTSNCDHNSKFGHSPLRSSPFNTSTTNRTSSVNKTKERKPIDFLKHPTTSIRKSSLNPKQAGREEESTTLEHASIRKRDPKSIPVFRDLNGEKGSPLPYPLPFPRQGSTSNANPKDKKKKRESIRNFAHLLFSRRLKDSSEKAKREGRTPLKERDTNNSGNGAVIVPPPRGLQLRLRRRQQQLGEQDLALRHAKHDSAFSSSPSLEDLLLHPSSPSPKPRTSSSPASKKITLSHHQLSTLLNLLQKLSQELRWQKTQNAAFEANVLFLLSVKEATIRDSKKLNGEWKRGLLGEIDGVREELGRTFSRKSALIRRGIETLRSLQNELSPLQSKKAQHLLEGEVG